MFFFLLNYLFFFQNKETARDPEAPAAAYARKEMGRTPRLAAGVQAFRDGLVSVKLGLAQEYPEVVFLMSNGLKTKHISSDCMKFAIELSLRSVETMPRIFKNFESQFKSCFVPYFLHLIFFFFFNKITKNKIK